MGSTERGKFSKRKKICFITTVSLTLKAFVLELAKYMYKTGEYDISFICNPDEEFQKSLPTYIHFIPIKMKRGISISGIKAMLQMRKIFRRENFDMIQYSTPNASFYASLAGKWAKVPVRLYCQWGIAYVGFSGFKRKIFKLIEKINCSFATEIEPDSLGNLQFSINEGLYSQNKGKVIWNGSAAGVDLSKFNYTQKTFWRKLVREKLQIPLEDFVYGFVGRITGDKGINELFAAAQEIIKTESNVWLMIVGAMEKSNNVQEDLYKWAVESPKVIFCGFTSHVEQFLSAMDIYVLPSYREGFGSSIVEAEAMGVPVIVTNIPGPTNAMIPDKTGLVVEKKDEAALMNAMQVLYNDEEKREEFGKNGYKYAVECFEQKELFARILEDREKLLNDVKKDKKNE